MRARAPPLLPLVATAGVPASRYPLAHIALTPQWRLFSDARTTTRELAEMVAALSFHDLHVMAVVNGNGGLPLWCYRHLPASIPTYVKLDEGEYSAILQR
jgi:hypothetical protein